MPIYTDQTGASVQLAHTPKRIVSLVPSQTELLADLSLSDEVTGITKFCIHPNEWFRNKTRVGGTKTVDIEKLRSLQPDLVLANKEENEKEQIEAVRTFCPVWTSDITTLTDALGMIRDVGRMTGKENEAVEMVEKINRAFSELGSGKSIPACYLIWKEPLMTVGGDTFISDLMAKAGFLNVFSSADRYPMVTDEEIKMLAPKLLFLSSEPYPFKEKHLAGFQEKFPDQVILLADGEMFSWYGSRLLQAPDYFRSLRSKIETMI
jgi:ABC-type Fe3+-hydroxamate transport system substrate-binding protein